MKIACISDVHSNLEALTKALEAIRSRGADAIYCLGDVVGYGADASACVDLVREHCAGVAGGNHDVAVGRGQGVEMLPPEGQQAALHNREQLSEEQRAYLGGLPLRIEENGCTFVHATPDRPELWLRVDSFTTVQAQFEHFSTAICFVGHTHIPGIASNKIGVLKVRPGNRYLINVGSIGQPRDKSPRLAFGLFDTEAFTYELVRIPYDVGAAANKIRSAGLPPNLARRLERGE